MTRPDLVAPAMVMTLVGASAAGCTAALVTALVVRPTPARVHRLDQLLRRDAAPLRHRPASSRRRPRPLPAVAATTILAVAVVGPMGAAAIALGATAITVLHPRRQRMRHRRHLAAITPDVVEMMVLVIHAGLSPAQAVLTARELVPAAARPGFDAAALRLERGHRLADALLALPEHLGPGGGALADAIGAADRYGLALPPILDRLADEARADRRRQAEADARTLSVRLSFPLVVCTLPAFVLLAIAPALLGALSTLGHASP